MDGKEVVMTVNSSEFVIIKHWKVILGAHSSHIS